MVELHSHLVADLRRVDALEILLGRGTVQSSALDGELLLTLIRGLDPRIVPPLVRQRVAGVLSAIAAGDSEASAALCARYPVSDFLVAWRE